MKGHIKDKFTQSFKEKYIPIVYYAQKYVNDHDTAKEIVHNVYINLWEKRNELDWDKCLDPYLYRSTYNLCMNHIRDNNKFDRDERTLDMLDQNVDYDLEKDPIAEREMEILIKTLIRELPGRCKKVFLLSRFRYLKNNEIAEKLNISVKTVETHMSIALVKIRKGLNEYIKLR